MDMLNSVGNFLKQGPQNGPNVLDLGGSLFNLFKNRDNPSDKSMPYLDQAIQNFDPFKLASQNPTQLLNSFGQDYKESPGYKFALQQALGASNRQNSAMGFDSAPKVEFDRMKTASNLASQDTNNWLQKVLELYGMGLHSAEDIGSLFQSKANNAFQAQNMKNQQDDSLLGDVFSIGSKVLPFFF